MIYVEIPSDDEVVAALNVLNGRATARDLCDKLVSLGHPRPDSQLAIQRAIERNRLFLDSDWMLGVPHAEKVAA